MKVSLPLLAAGAWTLLSPSLHAQLTNIDWTGSDEGNWSTAASWSSNSVPNNHGLRARVGIGATPQASLLIGAGTTNLGGLFIGEGSRLQRGPAATGDRTFDFAPNPSTLPSGEIVFENHGVLASGGTSGSMILRFNSNLSGGSVTNAILNTGIMEASSGTALRFWQRPSGGGVQLNNTGGTLRTVGSGQIYLPSYVQSTFTLSGGTIDNQAGAIYLAQERGTVEMTDTAVTNGGLIRMERTGNGGTNYLWRFLNGSLTNTGTIEIIENMQVNSDHRLAKFEISGSNPLLHNSGSLLVTGRGTQELTGSNWWNDTTPRTHTMGMVIANSKTFENNGVIEIRAESDLTFHVRNQLYLNVTSNADATFTLSGVGTLFLNDQTTHSTRHVELAGGQRIVEGVTYTANLVNLAGHTIRGGAAIYGFHTFHNEGVLAVDSAKGASLSMQTANGVNGRFSNSGELRVAAGRVLSFGVGDYTSSGVIQVDGELINTSPLLLTGGSLRGSGTVTGDLQVEGAISIQPEGSTLTLDGHLSFAAAMSERTHAFHFADAASRLTITGDLAIGSLNQFEFTLSETAGYQAGTIYTLVIVGGSGSFDLTQLALSAASLDAGFTLDESFGTDGWLMDHQQLQVQFSTVAPIPEGETLLLLGIGLFVLLGFRRSRSTLATA